MDRRGSLHTNAAWLLAGVGLTELALARSGRSVLDGLGTIAIDWAPVPAVELGVRTFGTADKPLLRLQSLGALVGGGAVAASRIGWGRSQVPGRTAAAAAVGLASLAAARRTLARRQPTTLPALATAATPAPPAHDGPDEWPGATPYLTPLEDFYVTDVTMRPPVVDVTDWRLEVTDARQGRAVVDAERLADMGLRERDGLLACVHNRPGWDRLGQQRWTGLPVVDLLDALGLQVPSSDADLDLVMEGADGLVMTLPWRDVVSRDSWVVTGMGGQPLSASHGHPARVLTPGLPGQYSGVKWLTRLRLAPTGEVTATWVRRGWPRGPVVVPLMARIDSPGTVGMPPRLPARRVPVPSRLVASGVGWAPAHAGVAAVEVRVDDGPWRAAELDIDRGANSWRRWRIELDLPPGDHVLAARCRGNDGTIQAGTGRPPFPDGADGYHRVRVTVDRST